MNIQERKENKEMRKRRESEKEKEITRETAVNIKATIIKFQGENSGETF